MTDPRATNPILYDGDMRILEVRADHPALADTVVVFGGRQVPLADLVALALKPTTQAEVYRRARWYEAGGGSSILKCSVKNGGDVIGRVDRRNDRYYWIAGPGDAPIASGVVYWSMYQAQRAVRNALREAHHVE